MLWRMFSSVEDVQLCGECSVVLGTFSNVAGYHDSALLKTLLNTEHPKHYTLLHTAILNILHTMKRCPIFYCYCTHLQHWTTFNGVIICRVGIDK